MRCAADFRAGMDSSAQYAGVDDEPAEGSTQRTGRKFAVLRDSRVHGVGVRSTRPTRAAAYVSWRSGQEPGSSVRSLIHSEVHGSSAIAADVD